MAVQLTAEQKRAAVEAILDAIVDAVRAGGGLGTPAGTLYAALMMYGCSQESFDLLVRILVARGRLIKRGQLYLLPKGVPNNGVR